MLSEKLYVLQESDLYKIIGVEDTCDVDLINKTYKNIAKILHPDIYRATTSDEKEQVKQIFSKITSAYNILKDPEKRKTYDYEKKLRLEYQKTLDFVKKPPENKSNQTNKGGGGYTISISLNTSNAPPPKQKPKEENKPEQAETLFNSALNKYQQGNIEAAILDLQTAMVVHPKVAKYHSTLGLMMREKGWHGYAQAQFKTALFHDPKDKIALKYLDEVQNVPQTPAKEASKQTGPTGPRKPATISPQQQQHKVTHPTKQEKERGLLALIFQILVRIFSMKK